MDLEDSKGKDFENEGKDVEDKGKDLKDKSKDLEGTEGKGEDRRNKDFEDSKGKDFENKNKDLEDKGKDSKDRSKDLEDKSKGKGKDLESKDKGKEVKDKSEDLEGTGGKGTKEQGFAGKSGWEEEEERREKVGKRLEVLGNEMCAVCDGGGQPSKSMVRQTWLGLAELLQLQGDPGDDLPAVMEELGEWL